MTIGVENVDKTVAWTWHVILFCRILLGVGHEEIAIYILDPERGIASRKVRIGEPPVGGRGREFPVRTIGAEHIYRTGVEVGGEQERSMQIHAKSKTLIHGALFRVVGRDNRVAR